MNRPAPREMQTRRIRHTFGVSPHQAKLMAELIYGEVAQ
jgi:hypothetical protein